MLNSPLYWHHLHYFIAWLITGHPFKSSTFLCPTKRHLDVDFEPSSTYGRKLSRAKALIESDFTI